MKDLLLVEKSQVMIESTQSDPYVLEGIFTELATENRNGRVYTKDSFLPHMETLSKIIDQKKCLGELDHPKVFETSLKNASHMIEKIWFNESDNKVYGRIKLLDTTAGKEAKALIDAGIPLHISSRAAGTVAENKTVKIHKLFTYDLVADPGFENAQLHTVNESYGFANDETSNFFIYEVNESKSESTAAAVTSDAKGLVKESDLNEFSAFTKKEIDSVKEQLAKLVKMQEALSIQNDEIAEGINSEDIEEAISNINAKIESIEKWATHVREEFEDLPSASEERIKVLEDKLAAIENWSEHVTETVTAIEDWSEHTTETVTAIEDWSEHTTETVTAIETWSDEATTNIVGIKEWSEHTTESVTKLEEGATSQPIAPVKEITAEVESLDETYTTALYTKIDSIIENAKKQKAEENKLIEEAAKANIKEEELWLSMMPSKYSELWEALAQNKKSSIEKRANICDFSTEKSIKEFWDATFAGTTIEMIKESAKVVVEPSQEDIDSANLARRQRIIDAHKRNFGN
jgi:methyl-accepting chemotaxis protein